MMHTVVFDAYRHIAVDLGQREDDVREANVLREVFEVK